MYTLSLSYGKDSLACLGAIEQLGWPLDRIVHAEVWATDTIPADLPPMVEFKKKADRILKGRWGIEVEHVCSTKRESNSEESPQRKRTYENTMYEQHERGKHIGQIRGFPMCRGGWCQDRLKGAALDLAAKANLRGHLLQGSEASPERERERHLWVPNGSGTVVQQCSQESSSRITGWATKWSQYCTGELKRASITDFQSRQTEGTGVPSSRPVFSSSALSQGADKNTVIQYLGIAADEPERIARHTKPGYLLPLVEIGWDEAHCRQWCEENDLLSPIYTTATRGGCWFCHNQGVGQLRLLRANYPDLWELLLKWDNDSPVTFKPDGHTVHDFDRRFQLEDEGLLIPGEKFRWSMLEEELNLRLF